MAPKGGNAKKESGRAKKAENEANKRVAAKNASERAEAEKWVDGARSNKAKEEKEEKRKAELARKAENARLLAEEENSVRAKKVSPKPGAKKAVQPKPAGPGAIVAGGVLAASATPDEKDGKNGGEIKDVESYSATGIDNALDLLEVVTAKMDKASVGSQAAGIEKHPEVRGAFAFLNVLLRQRLDAAFNAYVDRELPNIRDEQPGLRLQQYKDLLFKQFQRSPENPFNQTTVEYNATNDEKVEALRHRQEEIRDRLREKS
ncbi:hypothetical protein B0F90DRAFT_1809558 [Multifurca ochricompacta]|uniref:DUF1014-domain-containing protein n=1 Tax=Multifurca ochricompacta TaxID=376703 RepID=A0AAD4M5L2_9AGAM|nr:hypothetical protein B0F90DRAFT_1809558 [Multifurca ochricompacta]